MNLKGNLKRGSCCIKGEHGWDFVCYHEGETAAKTPYDCMHKLINGFTITDTTLGGEVFKEGCVFTSSPNSGCNDN